MLESVVCGINFFNAKEKYFAADDQGEQRNQSIKLIVRSELHQRRSR